MYFDPSESLKHNIKFVHLTKLHMQYAGSVARTLEWHDANPERHSDGEI